MPTIQFQQTSIPGVVLIDPAVFEDNRGFFYESYNRTTFSMNGIFTEFIQDNHSKSGKGVMRGLHFQRPPHAQAKLVRVIRGAIFDVVVDIRIGSPTFGKWFGVELTEQNKKMMYIPIGFAHGFYTLKDNTEFLYKCSDIYVQKAEGGIMWNDSSINIKWPLAIEKPIISPKDNAYLPFSQFQSPFEFS